jgi:hypothetical protein
MRKFCHEEVLCGRSHADFEWFEGSHLIARFHDAGGIRNRRISFHRSAGVIMTMKSIARMAALALALALLARLTGPALAQPGPPPELKNSKIDFAYIPPKTAKYNAILERLKGRQFLEQLSEFVSPLRLPHPFYLVTAQCDQANAFYNFEQWAIVLCYEWIELMDNMAPKAGQPVSGITREDVVIGETVATVLHEIGHAAFDMLRVPLSGREEDAADQFAIFLALQFSKDVARRIVNGEAYFWFNDRNPEAWAQYSDNHGTARQRFYNTLCMAYGGDPATFKDYVDKGWLPPERAVNCAAEYQQVRNAFAKTVLPFIDPELMKKVQARQWLKPPDAR